MAVGLVAANLVMGMSLVVGGLELPPGVHVVGAAQASPTTVTPPLPTPQAPARTCQEDDSCWVCSMMGDWVCGPGNDNGLTPGCYGTEAGGGSESGGTTVVLKELWPCWSAVLPNGERHIYRGWHDPLLPTQITTVIGPAIDVAPNPPRMGGGVG
jgi:hypothetical protein